MTQVVVQTRVDKDVAVALRERAKASERSLAAEVRLILKESVGGSGDSAEDESA